MRESNWLALDAFHEFCDEAAVPLNQIALQWLAAQSGVSTIIAGASTRAQFVANARAITTPLPASVLEAMDRVIVDVVHRAASIATAE